MDGELLLLLAGIGATILVAALALRSWWRGGPPPHPHETGELVYPPVAAHQRSHEPEGGDEPPPS